MRKLAAALVLLGASSAFACPNLAGTYSCQGDNGPVQTTIAQETVNGITTYNLTDDQGTSQFIADGKIRSAAGKAENGNDATMDVRNTCTAKALVIDVKYNEYDATTGKPVLNAKLIQNVSLDAGANLFITGTYTENGGAPQRFQGTCAKQ